MSEVVHVNISSDDFKATHFKTEISLVHAICYGQSTIIEKKIFFNYVHLCIYMYATLHILQLHHR